MNGIPECLEKVKTERLTLSFIENDHQNIEVEQHEFRYSLIQHPSAPIIELVANTRNFSFANNSANLHKDEVVWSKLPTEPLN